jgi:MOSC domain-containing protein YiiM
MPSFRVAQVRVGRPKPFGLQGQPSAIIKKPAKGPVMATEAGLAGDEQGDKKNHGGCHKAIHAYAVHHYPTWASEHPAQPRKFRAGSFGENLVVEDVTEGDICLGDQWHIGGALCEVSQGRQPCWKLNLRFGLPDMAYRVQRSGRTGWYFRVLEEGLIVAGVKAELLSRPNPSWDLDRVSRLLYHDTLDVAALSDFVDLPALPLSWQSLARRRLETGKVENWTPRIATPME